MTEVEKKILNFLTEQKDWVTRRQIAEVLDRERFNKWHRELLDRLIVSGQVEVQEIANPNSLLPLYQYRIKS